MRKGLRADDRKPFDSIFFDKTFNHGLKKEDAGVFADALEAARRAPSAGNQQPWRAVVTKIFRGIEEKAEKELKRQTLADCIERMRNEINGSEKK